MTMSVQYQLLDSGNLRKLEQVGPIRLIRPALNAFWSPTLPEKEWKCADAEFIRDASGNGRWHRVRELPDSWIVEWGGFRIKVKPTGFGHLGFFAEQFRNWEFFRSIPGGGNALNLFAYSGLASLALAESGNRVCHLDAARGMIEWGRANQELNPQAGNAIRWIADDVNKFVSRELRRGNTYHTIVLDPPTFGRGSSGQLWRIETDLLPLLDKCRKLRTPGRDFLLVLSCHSPGFSIQVMERMLREVFGDDAGFDSQEMTIPESSGRELPAGISVRCRVR